MSTYGKSCLQCTKSKVRCAYGRDRGPCERCARLRKECQAAPRTRVTKNKAQVDKYTALEAKVDSLVELLKRNQTIPGEDHSPHDVDFQDRQQRCDPAPVTSPRYSIEVQSSNELRGPDEPSSASYDTALSTATRNLILPKSSFCALTQQAADSLQQSDKSSLESHPTGTSGVSGGASSHTSPLTPITDIPLETEGELQDVLDTYRTEMFQFFPVVILGPEVTVEYMTTERPMVWLVLRTICSKKIARQLALSEEMVRLIASKLVVEAERSFDMLVALVLYANWGQFFCVKANLSPSIHLAMSLAGDLGLTKPTPLSSPAVMMNWTQTGCPKPAHALALKPRTMDERRVILGLFLVHSTCANFLQRYEPMRWTPYLDECLGILIEKKEYPSDEILEILIRIQIIANGLRADGWNEVYPVSASDQKPPRAHHVHLHKMQLDELKRSIPIHLKENRTLRCHILDIETSIYEHNLVPCPINSISDQTQRVEGLWACFSTIKTYFNYFFNKVNFPPLTYLYISMGIYTHIGHCLVTLFLLSTFESPDVLWDRQRIVSELDVGHVLREWLQIFESAPEAAGIDVKGANGQESPLEYSKKMMFTTMLKWWDSKIRPSIMNQEQQPAEQGAKRQQSTTDTFDASLSSVDFSEVDFNFDNEIWMRDIVNGGFDFRTY